jgi:hypothetical protein
VNTKNKGKYSLTRKLDSQPQTSDVTTTEREEIEGDSDEERDKRDKQFDGKRDREEVKQVRVERHTHEEQAEIFQGWMKREKNETMGTNSEDNTCLVGDERSFAFGSMLT